MLLQEQHVNTVVFWTERSCSNRLRASVARVGVLYNQEAAVYCWLMRDVKQSKKKSALNGLMNV